MLVSLEIDEVLNTEVLIVGGGTSGCLAALAAADEGCQVMIVERDHALGGVGTRAGCHVYWYGSTGGFQHQIDRACTIRAKVFGGIKSRGFHPDAKRSVLGEWMLERGVKVMFDTVVFEVLKDGDRLVGIVAASRDRVVEIRANVTIDCSGDGDLAAYAGVPYTLGRESDGIMQGYSLLPRVVYLPDKVDFINYDVGWADTLDTKDLSRAYRDGRLKLKRSAREDQRMLALAPQLGIREGRHIAGKYTLTIDDFVLDRHFEDTIIRAHSHFDNHANDFGNETDFGQIWTVVFGLFRHGVTGNIPYRSILPDGLRGLLVACRALSIDRDTSMAVRMQRDMQKLGEAAGTAAALCVKYGVLPDELDVSLLQEHLIRRKLLKPEDLHREETPDMQFRSGSLKEVVLNLQRVDAFIPQLIEYLGGEEEGIALWWLWKCGDSAVQPLISLTQTSSSERVRSAATFVLGLSGCKEAIPELLGMIANKDECAAEHGKSFPRWISALIVLRLLKSAEALPIVLDALEEPYPAQYYTFMLQYLEDILPSLSEEERRLLHRTLCRWLETPDLGDNYIMSGGKIVSLKWNLELKAALLLKRLGDDLSLTICRRYLTEEHALIRKAAEWTWDRLMTAQGEAAL